MTALEDPWRCLRCPSSPAFSDHSHVSCVGEHHVIDTECVHVVTSVSVPWLHTPYETAGVHLFGYQESW